MKGFSVIEVILAAALFMIFVSGISTVVITGLVGNRLGEEQTVAAEYAVEGLEAAKSIRNQDFTFLVNTSGTGITITGGVWTFSGTNNTFGKYLRTISVEDVFRDGSGNIVSSGGTVDADTKKVSSVVLWVFTPVRPKNVSLSTYLTNFRKSIFEGGLLIYSEGTLTPVARNYYISGTSFDSENPTVSGDIGRTFALKTSPTGTEAVAGYVDGSGVLRVLCYDGNSWTSEWSQTVGGAGDTRRFDISYETGSGDVVVLYGRNVGSTDELGYRTKAGGTGCGSSNWSSSSNLNPVRTSGTIHWVKMAWDRRSSSNLLTAIWADSNSDLSAMVWNGSSWGNEPSDVSESSLEVVATSQDIDDFDVEYESVSGDVMMVWANSAGKNNTNGVRYRVCTGGTATCSWGPVTTPPTFRDDATNLDISANPNTDEIVFASIGNAGSDLQIGYWSGTSWSNRANVDPTAGTPAAGTAGTGRRTRERPRRSWRG